MNQTTKEKQLREALQTLLACCEYWVSPQGWREREALAKARDALS